MLEQSPFSGAGEVLPKSALERLALFAEWTHTEPPAQIIALDGAFSTDLLTYAQDTGLSLDWFCLGDERGLVTAALLRPKEAGHDAFFSGSQSPPPA